MNKSENPKTRVLVIEDEITQQLSLEAALINVLAAENLEIEWVENATKAFERLKRMKDRPYGLIITDIFLDGKITGIDFLKVCQSIYPQIPLMVISGLPFEKFRDFGVADLASVDYTQKPLDLQHFKKRVRDLLSR